MLNPYVAMEIISIIYISIILITLLTKWKKAGITTKLFAFNIVLIIIGTICDALEISCKNIPVSASLALFFITCLIGNSLSIAFSYYCTFQANSKEHLISIWIPRTVLIVSGLSMLFITICYLTGTLVVIEDNVGSFGIPIYIMFFVELSTTLFLSTPFQICKFSPAEKCCF